jgi:hypothetical protein
MPGNRWRCCTTAQPPHATLEDVDTPEAGPDGSDDEVSARVADVITNAPDGALLPAKEEKTQGAPRSPEPEPENCAPRPEGPPHPPQRGESGGRCCTSAGTGAGDVALPPTTTTTTPTPTPQQQQQQQQQPAAYRPTWHTVPRPGSTSPPARQEDEPLLATAADDVPRASDGYRSRATEGGSSVGSDNDGGRDSLASSEFQALARVQQRAQQQQRERAAAEAADAEALSAQLAREQEQQRVPLPSSPPPSHRGEGALAMGASAQPPQQPPGQRQGQLGQGRRRDDDALEARIHELHRLAAAIRAESGSLEASRIAAAMMQPPPQRPPAYLSSPSRAEQALPTPWHHRSSSPPGREEEAALLISPRRARRISRGISPPRGPRPLGVDAAAPSLPPPPPSPSPGGWPEGAGAGAAWGWQRGSSSSPWSLALSSSSPGGQGQQGGGGSYSRRQRQLLGSGEAGARLQQMAAEAAALSRRPSLTSPTGRLPADRDHGGGGGGGGIRRGGTGRPPSPPPPVEEEEEEEGRALRAELWALQPSCEAAALSRRPPGAGAVYLSSPGSNSTEEAPELVEIRRLSQQLTARAEQQLALSIGSRTLGQKALASADAQVPLG